MSKEENKQPTGRIPRASTDSLSTYYAVVTKRNIGLNLRIPIRRKLFVDKEEALDFQAELEGDYTECGVKRVRLEFVEDE